MVPLFYNLAFMHLEYGRVDNGGKSMGDDDGGAVADDVRQSFLMRNSVSESTELVFIEKRILGSW